jgi:hypothetical protein
VTNGAQVAQPEENWWVYWRPVLIPLILLVSRIWTKAKLAEYPWSVLSSDLCYFGVTFYVWALTVRLSKIRVSPPNRPFDGDDGEGAYIVLFLIVNFALSFLLYPMSKDISELALVASTVLAFVVAIGSPLYLRWRVR